MITVLAADQSGPPSEAHLLPCDIQWSGGAPVSTYFKPKDAGNGKLDAAFRGRRLCGTRLEPPLGYTGALLQV